MAISLIPNTDMDRLGKILKKSPKPPQNIPLGIPTNIAAGPLGFRAELDITPKGKLDRLLRLREDSTDSTAALDKKDIRASHVVFHNEKGEDQGLSAPGTPTTGTAVAGDEHGNDLVGEWFSTPSSGLAFMWFQCLSAPEEDIVETGEGESELPEGSRGMLEMIVALGSH